MCDEPNERLWESLGWPWRKEKHGRCFAAQREQAGSSHVFLKFNHLKPLETPLAVLIVITGKGSKKHIADISFGNFNILNTHEIYSNTRTIL